MREPVAAPGQGWKRRLMVREAAPKAAAPHRSLTGNSCLLPSAAFRNRRSAPSIIGLIGVLILVGFAMGDIQNVISGGAFSGGSDTLVKLGPEKVTDREMSRAMDRRLSQVRQENPEADLRDDRRRLRPAAERARRREDAGSLRREIRHDPVQAAESTRRSRTSPPPGASTASSASNPTATSSASSASPTRKSG